MSIIHIGNKLTYFNSYIIDFEDSNWEDRKWDDCWLFLWGLAQAGQDGEPWPNESDMKVLRARLAAYAAKKGT